MSVIAKKGLELLGMDLMSKHTKSNYIHLNQKEMVKIYVHFGFYTDLRTVLNFLKDFAQI